MRWSKGELPTPEERQWILDTFHWCLRHGGGVVELAHSPLVLPDDDFFPVDLDQPADARAQQLLHLVAEHAGLGDIDFQLHVIDDAVWAEQGPPQMELIDDVMPIPVPASVIDVEDDADLLALVDVFVLEVAFFLTGSFSTEPPSRVAIPYAQKELGEDAAAEIAAVFMGFGVFILDTCVARMPKGKLTDDPGLSDVGACFALALFMVLQELPYAFAREFMPKAARATVKKCITALESTFAADVERLKVAGLPGGAPDEGPVG